AMGLGRRGAVLGASAASVAFCSLVFGMENGLIDPASTYLAHPALPPSRLFLTLVLNVSAFLLAGALASFLAEQVQGARAQLAERQTRLDKLEALYSAIVKSISSGIVAVDEQGRITYLNRAGLEITGLTEDRVLGQSLYELVPALGEALAAMCGSIELLSLSPKLGEHEKRLMQVVRGEGERLEALLKDFLAFAKPASPQLAAVEAGPLVEETADVFRREAALKGIAVTVDAERGVWLSVDLNQIKSVMWNLLGNARDATEAGGRSTFSVALPLAADQEPLRAARAG